MVYSGEGEWMVGLSLMLIWVEKGGLIYIYFVYIKNVRFLLVFDFLMEKVVIIRLVRLRWLGDISCDGFFV